MRILQVFRSPVGGLFRHVRDLARGLDELGHEVGFVCDSGTGGDTAENLLKAAAPHCKLGIHRISISRMPGLGDGKAVAAVRKLASSLQADMLHGHGAKGGLYARLAARSLGMPAVYTPHGGSLHYSWSQPAGVAFLGTEWLLSRIGTGAIFVCDYERRAFESRLGTPHWPSAVVYNGLWPEEFGAEVLAPDASDFVFMGDLRPIKGIDVLIEALALVKQRRDVSATIVGDGPQQDEYQQLAAARGLSSSVCFPGRLPTREALSRGRTLVLPSRAESFPYVILEAAAQGKPVIASAVGGIPEMLPPDCLVPPEDAARLAARLEANVVGLDSARQKAAALRGHMLERYNAGQMAAQIAEFYSLSDKARRSGTPR